MKFECGNLSGMVTHITHLHMQTVLQRHCAFAFLHCPICQGVQLLSLVFQLFNLLLVVPISKLTFSEQTCVCCVEKKPNSIYHLAVINKIFKLYIKKKHTDFLHSHCSMMLPHVLNVAIPDRRSISRKGEDKHSAI